MSRELADLLEEQMQAVREKFPDLRLEKAGDGQFVVRGNLHFRVLHGDREVLDEYDVEISIQANYPDDVPIVRETGGRIPEDFHTFPGNRVLCLGAPLIVKMEFADHRTLVDFIYKQVVPFLFSHSYNRQYGEMPYGELPHGVPGILQSYKELFGVKDDIAALGLLKILADDNYRGHVPCPCGTGLPLRKCHGPQLLKVKPHQRVEQFRGDTEDVALFVWRSTGNAECLRVLPAKTLKSLARRGGEQQKMSLRGLSASLPGRGHVPSHKG